MSDVGERMLLELRRIREALEGSQPLGFGKKVGPTYVFVRHYDVGGETYFWYSRDKQEGQNVPIRERDLTGYLTGVWRFGSAPSTLICCRLSLRQKKNSIPSGRSGGARTVARLWGYGGVGVPGVAVSVRVVRGRRFVRGPLVSLRVVAAWWGALVACPSVGRGSYPRFLSHLWLFHAAAPSHSSSEPTKPRPGGEEGRQSTPFGYTA